MARSKWMACTTLACVMAAGTLMSGASAQSRERPLKPGQLPINDPGDVLTRDEDNSRRWRLRAQVRLFGGQVRTNNDLVVPTTQRIGVEKAQFVYPLIGETASSVPYPEKAAFRLQLDRPAPSDKRNVRPNPDWPVNESILTNIYDILPGDYQGPTKLMRLEVEEIDAFSVLLQIQIDTRSWETRIDEERADAIEWPTDPWPPQLVSNLEPHLFVDPDHPAIRELLANFLNGKNPREARPYALAKHLAGRVVEYIEFTDNDFHNLGRGANVASAPTVLINGFRVNGSVGMAVTGEGSRFDAACLLCALYRAAGLPARLVIGFDVLETQLRESKLPVMRSWVEFALLDEDREVTEWIPVDISRQRDFSDRAPALDRRWQFFGHNEELDFVVPISHHWHPPTSVTNDGPPALWGWAPEPVIPAFDSEITFEAFEAPTTARGPVDPYRR